MRKIISLLFILLVVTPVNGCLKRDEFENVTVYTTSYPIEFLTSVLYGYNSEVHSIYPAGVDINTYKLTSKQIRDYSKSAIFVYNGLTPEKQIAKDFVNENGNLRIIDVSFGLKYENDITELWLSPNNYLMLGATIKNNLQDFILNKYIKEEIENNYVIKLEEPLSLMDANLRNLGTISKNENKNILIASSKIFKFLENYGFEVIVLDDEVNLTTNSINNLKNNFKNGTYQYILVGDNEENSELIEELIANNAKVLIFKTMLNLTDEQRENNETYFTMMQENMEILKTVTIGN